MKSFLAMQSELWKDKSCRNQEEVEEKDCEDEYIDLIEKGLAKEIMSQSCSNPTPKALSWTKCFLLKDNGAFKIYDERDKKVLLTAKKVGTDFYISQYEDFPDSFEIKQDNPHDNDSHNNSMCQKSATYRRYCAILRLDCTNKGYRLFSTSCERCDKELSKFMCGSSRSLCDPEGRQLLGIIKQSLKSVANGEASSRYTEIVTPPLTSNAQPAVWCPRTIAGGLDAVINSNEEERESKIRDEDTSTNQPLKCSKQNRLRAAVPHWDSDLKSLVMNFREERVLEASAKNFILLNSNNEQVFQFGKISKGKYNVDFKFPVSPLQAFALALSACGFTCKQ